MRDGPLSFRGRASEILHSQSSGPGAEFLICDEMTAMLDMITQAQIWELMMEISLEWGLGLVVVTHSMALAERVCTRIIDLPDINGI